MEILFVFLCFSLLVQSPLSQNNSLIPPRGWNSYAAYGWAIDEKQFRDNAVELSRRLLDQGYEYAVVDVNWFRSSITLTDSIDIWGRVIPDPGRWPSSVEKGFTVVADFVHNLGLKFGIQVTSGINKVAVDQRSSIMTTDHGMELPYMENGNIVTADQIARHDQPCSYAPNFLAVDLNTGGGKAFLKSVYEQYAEWGVDFVKLDCVFGDHLKRDEIETVSEILKGINRPIVFSVSPGVAATPEVGLIVGPIVNMYRITPNNWDDWNILLRQFDSARDFAKLSGTPGLNGLSWPDLDILPFGWLTDPDSMKGPHRRSKLTIAEQTTEMTLWCMAHSPLMFGGDLKRLDFRTQLLLANPTLLEINADSSNNMEITNSLGPGMRTWGAMGNNGEIYVAIFNLGEKEVKTQMDLLSVTKQLPVKWNTNNCTGTDLWNENNQFANGKLVATIGAHACSLFTLTCS